MSIVSYNGVTLPYARITNFRQEALYDESGTDWYCNRFDIGCEAIVNADYLSLLATDLIPGGTPATNNAAAIMRALRTRLLQPRQQLSITFNGVELIPSVHGLPGTVDSLNGPQPQRCDILQLNNLTFLVSYSIVATYWENNTTSPSASPITRNNVGNNVLYNRWSETVDIDASQNSTRTRDGKLLIRSDNPDGVIADEVRSQMAVVGVPSGFIRQGSSYTVAPNGLGLAYRVVDQEVFKLPPQPAYEAEGHYMERSSEGDAQRYAEVRVQLRSSKNVDQARLVNTCVPVATQKLRFNGAPLTRFGTTPKCIPVSASLLIDLYQNVVECRITAMFASNKKRIDGLAGIREGLTYTPFSEAAEGIAPPAYSDRGNASLLLQAAAYYDPSLRGTVLDQQTGQLTAGSEIGTAGITTEA